MIITFECMAKGCSPGKWTGTLELIKAGNPCEAEVSAGGNRFHLIAGKHAYGNYLCIPNWGIGTEILSLSDCFWNRERLEQDYPELSKVDIISIVKALEALSSYVTL